MTSVFVMKSMVRLYEHELDVMQTRGDTNGTTDEVQEYINLLQFKLTREKERLNKTLNKINVTG